MAQLKGETAYGEKRFLDPIRGMLWDNKNITREIKYSAPMSSLETSLKVYSAAEWDKKKERALREMEKWKWKCILGIFTTGNQKIQKGPIIGTLLTLRLRLQMEYEQFIWFKHYNEFPNRKPQNRT